MAVTRVSELADKRELDATVAAEEERIQSETMERAMRGLRRL
jgi:hypothetical protein